MLEPSSKFMLSSDLPPEEVALLRLLETAAETPYLQGISHRYTQALFAVDGGFLEVCQSKGCDDTPAGTVVAVHHHAPLATPRVIPEKLAQLLFKHELQACDPQLVAEFLQGLKPDICLQGWYYVEAVYLVMDWQIKLCYPIRGREKTTPFHVSVTPRAGVPGALETCVLSEPPPEILYASPIFYEGGLCINWGAKYIGFGQLYLSNRSGPLVCDSEYVGQSFVQAVLAQLGKEINELDGKVLKEYTPQADALENDEEFASNGSI